MLLLTPTLPFPGGRTWGSFQGLSIVNLAKLHPEWAQKSKFSTGPWYRTLQHSGQKLAVSESNWGLFRP